MAAKVILGPNCVCKAAKVIPKQASRSPPWKYFALLVCKIYDVSAVTLTWAYIILTYFTLTFYRCNCVSWRKWLINAVKRKFCLDEPMLPLFTLYNVFSTLGGYHEYIGGYHEYMGGCSVHWGDTMSTLGGYHEYIGGYHEYIGGYHEYIGGYHEYMGDVQYIGGYHDACGGESW